MSQPIKEFRGAYRFLSNFYPCNIEWLGHTYPSVEHAFQAAKFPTHPHILARIQGNVTPGESKAIASAFKNLIEPSWFIFTRELVMFFLLRQKFAPGTELARKLIQTNDAELIEGNTWNDTFWGVCKGVGENNLGKILMVIRSELIAME